MRKIYLLLLFSFSQLYTQDDLQEVFTKCYHEKVWGVDCNGEGTCGPGATKEQAQPFINYLQKFLTEHDIKSVIDVGCGDFAFAEYVNWDGVDYLGIDIVEHVVKRNKERHGRDNVSFLCLDARHDEMPSADLLICKDTLQHLPTKDIIQLLEKFKRYKYCLIVNDVNFTTLSSDNFEIKRGEYRPIDLAKSPFNREGERAFVYFAGGFTKQIFYMYD